MLKLAEKGGAGTALDDFPLPHDGDAVSHSRNDAEVMGNQQQACAIFTYKSAEEVQDPGLCRDIKRRSRLVGDEEPGLERHCPGDHRALSLAA